MLVGFFVLFGSGAVGVVATLEALVLNGIVVLIGLAGLALLCWSLWSLWLAQSRVAPEPVARVLDAEAIREAVPPPRPLSPARQPYPLAAVPGDPFTPRGGALRVQPPPNGIKRPVASPCRPGQLAEQFRNLDWFQFEKIVALIYRKLGDEVERRGGANADGGIDLLLRRDGSTLGVQCKHWKTWQVGVKSMREFLGALTAAGLQEGVFVALGTFTPDATTLAVRHGIRLVNAADLAELVERGGVLSDPEFQDALTDSRKYCPKCERELILRTATKGHNPGRQFWGCTAYPSCNYILRT